MTNYEKIKAMSLEEMARILLGVNDGGSVSMIACKVECDAVTGNELDFPLLAEFYCPHLAEADADDNVPCHKCMEKWLRMEVSDENKA